MAKKVRASMSHEQMHDFASGPMKGKPEHVKKRKAKPTTEHSAYDWRSRNNLKRGTGGHGAY